MIWRCPHCRGALLREGDALHCTTCDAHYPSVGGIPDFRIAAPAWVDCEADREAARRLLIEADALPIQDVVRRVLTALGVFTPAETEMRVRRIVEGPVRVRREFEGWLSPVVSQGGLVLDLGCGPGTALAAAAQLPGAIGIDVSMVALVIADRVIRAAGGHPTLAAAMGEALPLADASLSGAMALDVVEHLGDAARCIRELGRVLKPGAVLAVSTPNRFSLSAEPHVHLWGVGWLPRRWQASYVHYRTGKSYEFTSLLSSRDLVSLLEQNGTFTVNISIPVVAREDIAAFRSVKAVLAGLYNRLSSSAALRPCFLAVAPFFHAHASRVASNCRTVHENPEDPLSLQIAPRD